MNKLMLFLMLMVGGLCQFTGCASMRQTWPELERNTENRITSTQEMIGDGLQRNMLTIDQSQNYLTTLEGIRNDYMELRGRPVYRDEWEMFEQRLDRLNEEINRALERPVTMERAGALGDRIIVLQRSIDDGEISRRLTALEVQEFQNRLDFIRRDYIRMTEAGRNLTDKQSMEISRQLDLLEADLTKPL